jgi:hypothetical protein
MDDDGDTLLALAKKLSLAGDSSGGSSSKEEKHSSKYASKNDKLDLAVSATTNATAQKLIMLSCTSMHNSWLQ